MFGPWVIKYFIFQGMPLQNLRFTMTYPTSVNLEQKIREFESGIGMDVAITGHGSSFSPGHTWA